MPTDPLRVVVYAAKSTVDRMGSIPDQVKACQEFAERQGWTLDGRPESDEAASAYSGNRGPGLERAMARAADLAQRHGRAGLVVWHSNRIARGGGDTPDAAMHLVEYYVWARRHNVELHSVQDDHTFSNPILAVVMGEMAHQESKIKAQNVRKGMSRRRARKMHTGGAIYGYERDPETGLRPNPEQAAVVERIFRTVAAGTSIVETSRILNREKIKPLRGKSWQQGSLSQMLKRRTYLGEIKDDQGEWIEAAHEAILSVELWEAANRRREAAAALKGRNGGPRPKAGHLLPGRMLRHAVCGHTMTPVSLDAKRDGTVTGRYECSGKKHGVCDGFRVDMQDVDEGITGYLAEVGIDVEASLSLVRDSTANRRDATAAELEAARRDAGKLKAERDRMWGLLKSGDLDAADWASFKPEHEEESQATAARIERLEAQMSDGESAPEIIVPAAADALSIIRAALSAGEADAVRTAVESLFSEFLIGEVDDLPEQAIAGRTGAAGKVREQIAAMEAQAGRTVAQATAEYYLEEAALDLPEPQADDPLDVGLWPSDRIVILPTPREDALQAIVEDGQPVYLVDDDGRSVFRKVPVPVTYNDAFTTKSSAPLMNPRTRSISAPRPLKMITGSAGSIRVPSPSALRTRSSTASPLEPFSSERSSTTRSGRRTSIARTASPASDATATRNPSARRLSARNAAVRSSSSTTSTPLTAASLMAL